MHALVFSLCCKEEKKKEKEYPPEDSIQPGRSSAVQFDPCISEGGFIARGEAHHFLGNAMKKAAVKCLQGCPGSSCLPGVLAMALPRPSSSASSGEAGVPRISAAPPWGRTAAAGHLHFCPSGTCS